MHWIDAGIFIVYMVTMLGIGYYFMRRNVDRHDFYVSGRNMKGFHVGLSVVATDVGGGFSIGLGGLGFMIGLSGSWMLFTGLVGAWLSAVFLIPKVMKLGKELNLLTFPQVFKHYYGERVALLAGIISAIGYLGFTSSQILAGAKLASATIVDLDLQMALFIMGAVAVVYTVMGGLKAVIYTDTIQWIILMAGLIFIGIPLSYQAVGGMDAIRASLPDEFLRLDNLSWQTIINWAVTIIPIWFVGMTLYQRIYACRDERSAKKAWFVAGLLEWPIMAFMGVTLGLLARVGAEQGLFTALGYGEVGEMDAEMGLPLLLRQILPFGLMGLLLSAYFSAILSTADSCLMAASGNVVTDIFGKWTESETWGEFRTLRLSQLATFVLGTVALIIASAMTNVLDLMLYSYAFMVSGLLVPLLAALFWKKARAVPAFWAMITGGSVTLLLQILVVQIMEISLPLGLDPNIFGISASALVFFGLTYSGNKYYNKI